MSLPKVTGIETEYAIVIRGPGRSNPFSACRLLLSQYRGGSHPPVPELATVPPGPPASEPPKSAGLGDLPVEEWNAIDPFSGPVPAVSALNDDAMAEEEFFWDPACAPENLMLANGARFYIDHGHPEYSTAEAIDARTVVAADRAGERVVDDCRVRANASGSLPAGRTLAVYKNNSDKKGNSYGCHENYLIDAETFEDLIHRKIHRTLGTLVPFLVTRSILCGAGKVGAENGTWPTVYQLSQRADFFETIIGLQTTHCRPLINIRDEPHADRSKFRRLHVIPGDANMAEYSTYLKVGTTQVMLAMLEDSAVGVNFTLDDPIAAFRTVSRDLTFREPLRLAAGGSITACEIQEAFLREARRYLEKHGAPDTFHAVVRDWDDSLQKLRNDWKSLGTRLDWAVKRILLTRFLESRDSDWETSELWVCPVALTLDLKAAALVDAATAVKALREKSQSRADTLEQYLLNANLNWADYARQREIYCSLLRIDLEYHEIRGHSDSNDPGLFARLEDGGGIERVVTEEEVSRLVEAAPVGTRAFLRGELLRRFPGLIDRVDWEEVRFRIPGNARAVLLSMPDPICTESGAREILEQVAAMEQGCATVGAPQQVAQQDGKG